MKAVVVRAQNEVGFDDVAAPGPCGETDVRVRIDTVGICGSDIHYVTHGRIGSYVVRAPMVLGHEASGVVTEVGTAVRHLSVGDRVCMEPGIPNRQSRAARLGIYNVDPDVVFWATPPVDGCLLSEVVHPAAFTYHLPDHSSPGRTKTCGGEQQREAGGGLPRIAVERAQQLTYALGIKDGSQVLGPRSRDSAEQQQGGVSLGPSGCDGVTKRPARKRVRPLRGFQVTSLFLLLEQAQ